MEEKPTEIESSGTLSDPVAVSLAATGSAHSFGLPAESFRRKLWRGRWLAVSTAVGFALLAMMLGVLQPPLYKAQISIEIQSPERNALPGKVFDQDLPASPESFLQTQMRIIQSRSLVERVLARLSDEERARLLDTPRFWWTRPSDQSVELIRHRVSTSRSGQSTDQTGMIDISFLSPDAAAGARFLNTLAQELPDFNVERSWRSVQHSRQWTERQIDELRKKWEQSEQVLAEYSQVSRLSPSPVSKTAAPEGNELKLRQLRNKLAELNKQIAEWNALYGSSGVMVQKLKTEAAQTEAAIRQHKPVLPGRTPSVTMTGTPQAMAHWNALQKEAESRRLIYETTAARLRAASVLTASQMGDITVVDPAVPATAPSTPSQLLMGALGAVMGLLLGISFVVLRDRFSSTFSEPALVAQYLGLHVLGAIPIDPFAQDGSKTYDKVNQEPALHLNFETDFHTAEAFRSIRSSILLGAGQTAGSRLVFTSPGALEGTTFVVANLGAALASAQRRVLLVDGNLRSPGLHKIFGADNEHGLADLLSRQIGESSMTSRDVIRETQIPDLYLLSAGQAGGRAPEILSSVHLPQLIRELAKGFDLVLVDSAPLLPYADTRSLAKAVDGAVLIVKAGYTNRQAALEARDAISQDGSPIIGAILTEWDVALSAAA